MTGGRGARARRLALVDEGAWLPDGWAVVRRVARGRVGPDGNYVGSLVVLRPLTLRERTQAVNFPVTHFPAWAQRRLSDGGPARVDLPEHLRRPPVIRIRGAVIEGSAVARWLAEALA